MHVLLNLTFNLSILSLKSGRSTRINAFLQPENIEKNYLALFTHKQKKIKVDILDADLRVEEEEKEIQSNLRLQYAWNIVKLQTLYKI